MGEEGVTDTVQKNMCFNQRNIYQISMKINSPSIKK